jgi:hypothetical protein
MPGLEGVIRPFQTPEVTPTRIISPSGRSSPPVHFSIGLRGGTKTFSFSGSTTMSTYMAQVNKEKASDAFDMSTGQLKQ